MIFHAFKKCLFLKKKVPGSEQENLWTDQDTATAISADIAVNRQPFSSLIQQHVYLLVFFLY